MPRSRLARGLEVAAETALGLASTIPAFLLAAHARRWRHDRHHGTDPGLDTAAWARLHARETWAAYRIAWGILDLPYGPGLRVPARPRSGPAVLCVHGFHLTAASIVLLRRHLERRGLAHAAVSTGLPYGEPGRRARRLADAARRLAREVPHPDGIDLVAYSSGGLVLRHALALDPGLGAVLRRAVTLGTPHRGTALLDGLAFGPAYRLMGREARFLRDLPPFSTTAPRLPVLTVGARPDVVVFPLETNHLPGTRRLDLDGLGHFGLATDPRSLDRVVEFLRER